MNRIKNLGNIAEVTKQRQILESLLCVLSPFGVQEPIEIIELKEQRCHEKNWIVYDDCKGNGVGWNLSDLVPSESLFSQANNLLLLSNGMKIAFGSNTLTHKYGLERDITDWRKYSLFVPHGSVRCALSDNIWTSFEKTNEKEINTEIKISITFVVNLNESFCYSTEFFAERMVAVLDLNDRTFGRIKISSRTVMVILEDDMRVEENYNCSLNVGYISLPLSLMTGLRPGDSIEIDISTPIESSLLLNGTELIKGSLDIQENNFVFKVTENLTQKKYKRSETITLSER